MLQRIPVAVVGCGYWGPNLMRNFAENPRAELRWIVDANPGRLARLSNRYPQAHRATDLAEALADPVLRAVAIATPLSTHARLAWQCLAAGKCVLVEKPMADSPRACRDLIDFARAQGLTLMVDHTFVYTNAVRKMREIIQAGELGEIYYFDSVRVNLGLFQSDTNVIWDLAPHDLSIMDYLLDKRPTRISAHGACHVAGSQRENIAYLTLKFADATLAHFHVNWLAPAKVRRILIGGSRKMLVFDDLSADEKLRVYDKGLVMRDGAAPDTHKVLAGYRIGDLHVPHIEPAEALQREVSHFLDCVERGARPETDGQAGLRVVEMLAAAQESLARDGAFVPLEEAAAFTREGVVEQPASGPAAASDEQRPLSKAA
jgi:predicted dehydrogenase